MIATHAVSQPRSPLRSVRRTSEVRSAGSGNLMRASSHQPDSAALAPAKRPAEAWREIDPDLVFGAQANRAFLGRAVRYLAGRQGSSVPRHQHRHPDGGHSRALLTSSPEGRTAYIPADLRDPGSFLVASHLTGEHDRDAWATIERDYRAAGMSAQWRDSDEFAQVAFTGLEMVPPGVVLVSEWRPDSDGPPPSPSEVSFYGGVARKPLTP